MSDLIQFTIENKIATIRINRPDKKNAITSEMYRSLTEAFNQAASSSKVRVLLITGTKDTFTAGNDLSDFLHTPPTDQTSPVFQFLQTLAHFKKPLIAAATGPAVGIGMTLLLHCDLVYLGESTKLKLPFVSLGLCPEAASSYLLPALAGYQRAAEAILLGETINAEKALSWGLANDVFSDEDYQKLANEKAEKLASQPASAVRLSKKLLKQSHKTIVNDLLDEEAAHFLQRLASPEAKEAFTAFFEKRLPDFFAFE